MISRAAYNNAINNLNGYGLTATQAAKANTTALFLRFNTITDMIDAPPVPAGYSLKTAYDFATSQLGAAAVAAILDELQPGLSQQVASKLSTSFETLASTGSDPKKVARAYANVKSILGDWEVRAAAEKALKAEHLTVTEVAYNDGSRTSGVWGDQIADTRYEVFETNARRHVGHGGVQDNTFAAPIVKESNWDGPFAVADLAGLSVTTRDGKTISIADAIQDPAKYINNWNGPDHSFWSEAMDPAVGGTLNGLKGPKVSVQDSLIPVADGHTETVPTIYTYHRPTLVLIAVPGEGISAHYTNGNGKIQLPIIDKGKEKALRITREEFSSKKGPTSFNSPGENLSDGQLVNSAIIVQIPVNDPNHHPRRLRGGYAALESFGPATAKSLSFGATRGISRGGAASLDAGEFGTGAGIVSAGAELGDQKSIPSQITRTMDRPVVVTYSIYAATDSNVIGAGLAKRMRHDIDAVKEHPAFKASGVENP